MKITIFGSYNAQSIGDKAILIGLLNLLDQFLSSTDSVNIICPDQDAITSELANIKWDMKVSVSELPRQTGNQAVQAVSTQRGSKAIIKKITPEYIKIKVRSWRIIYKYLHREQQVTYQTTDGLIIGGGNLLMDLFPLWPAMMYEVFRLHKKNGVPVIFAGVGAYPMVSLPGKILLKRMIRGADAVYVRDRSSQKKLQKRWNKNTGYTPDFAFSYPLQAKSPAKGNRLVAVNIASLYSKHWVDKNQARFERFTESISRALYSYYLSCDKDLSLSFFDTNYPTDRIGSLKVVELLEEKGIPDQKLIYQDRLMHSSEILEMIQEADLAITTRLHAAILSLITDVPVITIAYQPKVRWILNDLGLQGSIIDPDQIIGLDEKLLRVGQAHDNFHLSGDDRQGLHIKNLATIKEILAIFSRAGNINPKEA